LSGLTRYMVLVTIDYATRKVNVAGIIQQAHARWMRPKGQKSGGPVFRLPERQEVPDPRPGPLFTEEFREVLKASGIKPIKTLPWHRI